MHQFGGRRIKGQSILMANSVDFCTQEMIQNLKKYIILRIMLQKKKKNLKKKKIVLIQTK